MSKLRSINTAFWSDTWIETLDPNYKLLFLYLVTNDKTNMLGIYEASIRKISFETGLDIETVENGLKAFERVNKVKYIDNYIILVNYMKHQNYNTNMKKSAIDIYNNLPKELRCSNIDVSKSNPSKGFETLLNHYGMVRKVEVEVEDEVEIEVKVEDEVEEKKQQKIDVDVYEDFKNQIAQEGKTTWIESFYMKFKLKEKSLSKVMDEFILHVKCLPKGQPNTIQEFKQHFYNWCLKVDSFGKLDAYKKHKPKEKGAI